MVAGRGHSKDRKQYTGETGAGRVCVIQSKEISEAAGEREQGRQE